MKVVGLLFGLLLAVHGAQLPMGRGRGPKSYQGYKVIQVTPETEDQLKFLQKLTHNAHHVDFWTEPRVTGVPVSIMITPEVVDAMHVRMEQAGLHVTVLNHNVQEGIDEEKIRLEANAANKNGKAINLDDFNQYADIMSWMEELKNQCPSGLTCETYSIGQSIYNNDLTVFKISKPGPDRRAQWLDSTIHAREWIATGTVLKMLDNLVNNYESDDIVRELVDRYDWYLLPVMNPDGYLWSWSDDRYWRKNMNEDGGDFFCWGTDLNRNYDSSWLTDGASDWICLDVYGGTGPASELETQAVQAEAQRIGATVDAWVSIHSFSNLWLTPYGATTDGFTCKFPENYQDVLRVANAAADAVENTFGTSWERGSTCSVLYAASGATIDYVLEKTPVKYSFTPELRGTDFVISPDNIDASFREIWNGVVAMIRAIEQVEKRN